MDTFGWDTIFIVDIDFINQALAKSSAQLISRFSYSTSGRVIEGTFGAWSIQPGESGKILQLRLPIASGIMGAGAGPEMDLSGVTVTVNVALQMRLPPDGSPGQSLLFDFRPMEGVAAGNGTVTPAGVDDPGNVLSPMQRQFLNYDLAQCLVDHADEISFVFATVNPLAAADMPWLRPVSSDYYCGAVEGRTSAVMAILSVNDSRDISALRATPDFSALPESCNAAMVIAPSLFLLHMLAPAFGTSFGVAAETFTLADPLTLSGAGFSLPRVSAAGEHYYPTADSLTAKVEDTKVAIALSGSCSLGMGISMTFSSTSVIEAVADLNSPAFTFRTVGTPTFSDDTHTPWYDYLVGVVMMGVPALVLKICVDAVSSALGHALENSDGADQAAVTARGIVSWAGAGDFTPFEGGLATALYLRGNFGILGAFSRPVGALLDRDAINLALARTPTFPTEWMIREVTADGGVSARGMFGPLRLATEEEYPDGPYDPDTVPFCLPLTGGEVQWESGGETSGGTIPPCTAIVLLMPESEYAPGGQREIVFLRAATTSEKRVFVWGSGWMDPILWKIETPLRDWLSANLRAFVPVLEIINTQFNPPVRTVVTPPADTLPVTNPADDLAKASELEARASEALAHAYNEGHNF